MTQSPLPTVRSVAELRASVRGWREAGLRVALVPTMGFLHQGHLSLVRLGHARADRVVASLFVNPTQFAPSEDFEAYPRDEARDGALLASAGCDLLYAPTVAEMYPHGLCHHGQRRRRLRADGRPGAPDPLRRRRHHRRQAAHPVPARRRDLRREGLPAAHGDQAPRPRPRSAGRDRRRADGARTRRPRPLLAQQLPDARRSAASRRCSTPRCARPARRCGPARRSPRPRPTACGARRGRLRQGRLLRGPRRRRPRPPRPRPGRRRQPACSWRPGSARRG